MATPITLSMEGTMLNWLKNVGDAVKQGDVIAEVESDKATVEVEAPADGVLLQADAQPGDSLDSGAVIGTIGAAGEQPMPVGERQQQQQPAPQGERIDTPPPPGVTDQDQPSSVLTGAQTTPTSTQPMPDVGAQQAAPTAQPPEGNGSLPGGVKASPLARRIADEKGIDLRQVKGSGPGGRIVKEDVENFKPSAAPAAPAAAQPSAAIPATPGLPTSVTSRKLPEGPDVEIIDLSTMRKRIAAGTIESNLSTPTFFVTIEIDVNAMLALRKQLNDSLTEGATKISVNDLIVKAVALGLRQFPNLNSHYYGDRLARHKRINIGIAVAVPGGVMYVVAKDADRISLSALAEQNKAMATRARDGKIKPEDIGGATFSISNLGPYNVEHFTAIINPPEAGVLAVGTAKPVPVVQEDGTLGVGNRMRVTLSVDHRVSDGAEGADFLQAVRQLIENPMRLLI